MRYIWVGYVILFWLSGCVNNRAYDAYQQKDFVTAAREFRLLADAGDARAQAMLGYFYFTGEGVAKDATEAARWYHKAAEQDNASAQHNLGRQYYYGEGVAKDTTEAARWFRKAADQGGAPAQAMLGYLYENGEGVAKASTEAARWFRKAADQGNAYAQMMLGYLYSKGEGVVKDANEAVRWYRKAADQGHASAQYSLGNHYREGEGVPKNTTEGVRWVRKAADQGDADAQAMLGYLYQKGQGVAKDTTEAARWFRKAADQGNAFARDTLADLGLEPQSTVSDSNTELQKPGEESVAVALTAPQASPLPSIVARRALIIGNAAYGDQPLRNSLRDATELASLLDKLGFEITLLRDADLEKMKRAVRSFTTDSRGSIGLFFFSGHGVQAGGQNYLIPVQGHFETASDIEYGAVPADWILDRMDEGQMTVKFLILDACRDSPYGRGWTRSLSKGLAQMSPVEGSLIAYATSPGKTAADGEGPHSPYTTQLLKYMPRPDLPVERMFKEVRKGVMHATNNAQTPWEFTSLTGEFTFASK